MNPRRLPDPVQWCALLDAISHHLTAPGPGPEGDVRIAIAAIEGRGLTVDAVEQFTALLNSAPLPDGHGPNHIGNAGQVVSACAPGECITCHGTVDAGGTFHPAQAAS